MSQIPAGTVTGEKTLRQIRVDRPVRDRVATIGEEPEHVEGVLELRREPVLRRPTVIHRDHDGVEPSRESPADGVVVPRRWRQQREPSPVEEHDHGESIIRIIRCGVCGGRDKEAEPEVAGGVEGEVVGGDGVARDGVGGKGAVEEVDEAAVDGAVGVEGAVGDEVEDGELDSGSEWEGEGGRGRRRRHFCREERRSRGIGFSYVNETVWDQVAAGVVTTDPDCNLWSNDQSQLCYSCDSCKAGVLASIKHSWRKVSVIDIVIVILLVILYIVAYAALKNNKRMDNDECYGETRMTKSQPGRYF